MTIALGDNGRRQADRRILIIFRYLTREILTGTFAINIVLLFVILSSRFGRFLNEAVSGRISADVLFSVIALRIPVILELVLPLSFFIALLFALGRLYIDSEITALSSCGYSRRKLLWHASGSAFFIAALVALLSLWLSPLSLDQSNSILERERARHEFETLSPGQFQVLSETGSVIYTEAMSADRKILQNVFAADLNLGDEGGNQRPVVLVKASAGEQIYDDQYQRKYLRISDGVRVEGEPGSLNYRVVEFESYAQLLEEAQIRYKSAHDRMPTLALMKEQDAEAEAALHWRFSMPVLVMVLVLLGVPLAQTDPRRGRYTKMIPAVLLYMGYLVVLNATRGSIEDGDLPANRLWWVHAGAIVVGLFIFNSDLLGRLLLSRRRQNSHA
ncbi:LPS export ABC transporter permease LptF [Halioxenophilus sp. WMMB6]|uniref:LPS export ABC transporter permease LptF n=1 Tax=Halioxenophilus sp. WMMB6 TaxID=3073815 RepID=UPI00295ECD97|nr:LPS export ABC transporter permease LptF [Halioxenophilus sp. WMMB6]